jgi:hypothetical protein
MGFGISVVFSGASTMAVFQHSYPLFDMVFVQW